METLLVSIFTLSTRIAPPKLKNYSRYTHAKTRTATPDYLFSVLSFWDKHSGICAGCMQYRRDFPTTRVRLPDKIQSLIKSNCTVARAVSRTEGKNSHYF